MENIYDITVIDGPGNNVQLDTYKNNVVLIVNVASKCGFTPQYEGLEKLYEAYKDKDFVILGFPCNQFANQEPGTNDEIQSFCQLNYGVTFPVMAKINVNGQNEHPLYTFLKKERKGFLFSNIKWNFTKFLVNKDGDVVKRYAPNVKPEELVKDIEALL